MISPGQHDLLMEYYVSIELGGFSDVEFGEWVGPGDSGEIGLSQGNIRNIREEIIGPNLKRKSPDWLPMASPGRKRRCLRPPVIGTPCESSQTENQIGFQALADDCSWKSADRLGDHHLTKQHCINDVTHKLEDSNSVSNLVPSPNFGIYFDVTPLSGKQSQSANITSQINRNGANEHWYHCTDDFGGVGNCGGTWKK